MSQDNQITVWTLIEGLIDRICSFQSITANMSMVVYTATYEYLMKSVHMPSKRQTRPTVIPVGTLGEDLYDHISLCLENKLKFIVETAKNMLDEDVVRLYEMHWSQYKIRCQQLEGSCSYVNRYTVTRAHNAGYKNFEEVGPMSRKIWERVVIKSLLPRVIDACCNMIRSQRNGQTVDTEALKNIFQIFVNQDFNVLMAKLFDQNLTHFDFYKENIESKILVETREFYCQKTIFYDETQPIIIYLNAVAQYIDEEIQRVQSYLPESTKLLLIKIIDELFIRDYEHVIQKEINTLLENHDQQNLTDLFKPISRILTNKSMLVETVQNHIKQIGIDGIKKNHTIATQEPKVYIDTIIDILQSLTWIKETFNNDPEFTTAFDRACANFINKNSVTESVDGISKTSESLVQYCDMLLRKSNKIMDETEIEEKFNQIMLIFNFIDDKDVYEKLYRKMLGKRLINQLSVSDDYEKSVISKLKEICGMEYTSKLERMIHDIDISRSIHEEYQNKQPFQFSIMILTSNSWLLSRPPSIILSNELRLCFDDFLQFYNRRYTGRKLNHAYQSSKGELQTCFTKQKYILQVSIYQMVILLLFNQSLQWTIEEIVHQTNITTDVLIQIIYNLIQSNLLKHTQIDTNDLKENNLQMKSIIELTTDYKSQKSRINLNQPIKSNKEKEIKNFQQSIDGDRQFIIQATIVRIMKEQKLFQYSLLIQKVIEQLNSRFKPNVSMIKKCIDILIEKEYLRRQLNAKDILEYLP